VLFKTHIATTGIATDIYIKTTVADIKITIISYIYRA